MKVSPKHVALLRGINVGGKNMLPMKELAAMFVNVAGRCEARGDTQGSVEEDA